VYNESHWGPMLFMAPLAFTIWKKIILQKYFLLYFKRKKKEYTLLAQHEGEK